ncbi:30S ribosomal protein S18 [Candidatus Woesebacteria bacterium GWC2_33_12]|nr:MAG: 30S ribosomal protein S18 [Candidatus Woesebacteria bacterium GWC2_33_12]OGM80369.1 MAG: 30S ribosomal protein S18 [Candidatus Woesebacteria bacterium RIFOXYB1_FULL_33_9]OGM86606.1 MAG: 30S ribosomal protein S18 [Candidatus Woesebacteria bacterium RIFOXYD1_FULL_33_11]HCR35629.1 30S ribosomal protein S18 [Candidatus Woesebacteria bacterium]
MAKLKQRRKIIKERPLSTRCLFCDAKKDPDYKDYENLAKYLSDRGRIFSRERSGVCAKHQRKLASEVKRARFLALLPY